ncbi:tautomerase family protein [Aerococcaceae bacterium NML201209]|nr:tautomerase family protein [Aerococcaceae bacterium NML201209]
MPFIHIELLEGRSSEAKAAMAKEIIETVAKHSGAPKERIHVIFKDMKKDNYYHETPAH